MRKPIHLDELSRTRVVIVADNVVLGPSDIDLFSREIDKTEERHTSELIAEISDAVKDIVVYNSPSEFINAIALHKHDLILPDWSGTTSKSRTGLIPAICESYGVKYVGADAYTKIISHDKFLAKSLSAQAGFRVPKGIYVDRSNKLDFIDQLSPPYIVKPCYEGSSIGIDDGSVVHSAEMAAARANLLLERLGSPVLVEEFQPGREVFLCLLGSGETIKFFEAGERYIPSDATYFDTHAFSFELKKQSNLTRLRLITDEITDDMTNSARQLFHMLQKVEVLRIDGRLSNGTFTVIELTPETHLGARAEYCGTFIQAGCSYRDILLNILSNSLDG